MSFRRAAAEDAGALRAVWFACFGREPELFENFLRIFGVKIAIVGELEGKVAAAAYILPTDGLSLSSGDIKACSYIYALGVLPEYRGRGYGRDLTKAAVRFSEESGFEYSCLRPSDAGLFDFYAKLGFAPYFRETRKELFPAAVSCAGAAGELSETSAEKYSVLRERVLSGTPHIVSSVKMLEFQRSMGALTELSCGCAAVEADDGALLIKELLVPEGRCESAVSSLAFAYASGRCVVTRPDPDGEFCGMIHPLPEGPAAFLGPAFD